MSSFQIFKDRSVLHVELVPSSVELNLELVQDSSSWDSTPSSKFSSTELWTSSKFLCTELWTCSKFSSMVRSTLLNFVPLAAKMPKWPQTCDLYDLDHSAKIIDRAGCEALFWRKMEAVKNNIFTCYFFNFAFCSKLFLVFHDQHV